MARILMILLAAAAVFMLIGVTAIILKVTAVLALAALGGLGVLSIAVWMLIRGNGDESAAR